MKTADEIMEILVAQIDKYDYLFSSAVEDHRPDSEIDEYVLAGNVLRVVYRKIIGSAYRPA